MSLTTRRPLGALGDVWRRVRAAGRVLKEKSGSAREMAARATSDAVGRSRGGGARWSTAEWVEVDGVDMGDEAVVPGGVDQANEVKDDHE